MTEADNPRAVIGANYPPLSELIADIPVAAIITAASQPLADRAAELLAAVPRATTAENATTLAGMIKTCLAKIDEDRLAQKKPFWDAGLAIDVHYNGIAGTLATVEKGKITGGALRTLLDLIDAETRRRAEEAAAEKRRLEREAAEARERAAVAERARIAAEIEAQRQRDEAAAQARREREEAEERIRAAEDAARRAGDAAAAERAARERAEQDARDRAEAGRREAEDREARAALVAAQIERQQAADQHDALLRQAAAVQAAPVATDLGVKAHGRQEWDFEILSETDAFRHAAKLDPVTIREAVETVIRRQIRAGVRTIPGCRVFSRTVSTIRTR